MEVVKHWHKHPLVLDECYHGGETNVCFLCAEPLRSPLARSVYRCTRREDKYADSNCKCMVMHKSCAELPLEITDYFMHPQHPIAFLSPIERMITSHQNCFICSRESSDLKFYYCESCDLKVCLKCVTSPLVYHPSHNQHALALVQRPATFRCDACGQEARDTSSCKCSACPFWIHTSCALLSSSFQSQFHTHPLRLAYSFPHQYLKFRHYCKICKKLVKPTLWLYYCPGCRIFVHLQCAKTPDTTLNTTLRPLGDECGDLVHLPSQDESSLNLLRQLLIHRMMINQGEGDALTWSFSPISTVTAAAVAGPNKETIHHWSHDQHPLILVNKCSTPNVQLMSVKDNNEDSDDDDTIILCGGCTNPINSSNTSYYECHPCKYYLHRFCAELPGHMQPYKLPYEFVGNNQESYEIIFTKLSSRYLFRCNGCNYLKSGIHIATDNGYYNLDIGCAMLPSKIKHEAHAPPNSNHKRLGLLPEL